MTGRPRKGRPVAFRREDGALGVWQSGDGLRHSLALCAQGFRRGSGMVRGGPWRAGRRCAARQTFRTGPLSMMPRPRPTHVVQQFDAKHCSLQKY